MSRMCEVLSGERILALVHINHQPDRLLKYSGLADPKWLLLDGYIYHVYE